VSIEQVIKPNVWHQNINYSSQHTKRIFNQKQLPEVNEILLVNQIYEDEKVSQSKRV